MKNTKVGVIAAAVIIAGFLAIFAYFNHDWFLKNPPWNSGQEERYLLVNRKENILYYMEEGRTKKKYPVSAGNPPELTPTGTFEVVTKIKEPGGSFGSRWIGLKVPEYEEGFKYGIHGTDEPEKIGQHASKGCIRMKNEDIEELYGKVSKGMKVKIIE